MVANMTLVKIASIGGIITCTTGLLYHQSIKNQIRNTPYYKEALKIVRQHNGAITLLGEPIREGSLDLGNTDNYCEESKVHIQVPVKGSKQKGTVFFWAKRKEDDKWVVHRIELGLADEPNRRLLIKDVSISMKASERI